MWVDCTLHLLWIWNMSSRQSPLLCLVVSLSSSSTSTSIFPQFKSPFATEWHCWIYIQSMQPNQLSLAFSSSLVQWIKVVQHFWDNNPGSRWCGCLDFTRSIFFVILAYGKRSFSWLCLTNLCQWHPEFETVKSRLTIDVNLSSPTDFTFHDCPLKLEAKNWGFRSCFYSLPKKEQSKLPIHLFIACEQPAPSPQNKLKIFFWGEGVAVQGYF